MITKQTFVLFALLTFTCLTTTQAQKRLYISHSCSFYGEEPESELYEFDATNEARQIVNELLQSSGLSANFFILKESNCTNALAATVDNQRYILYNPDFIRKFKQDAATKWAAYCVLAHEIGHLQKGHNLSNTDPSVRKLYELEADKFAGNLLFHLGATIDQAQMGIKTIPLEGETRTHPPKSARLVAITNGWTTAYDLSKGIQPKTVETTASNETLAKEWLDKAIIAGNNKEFQKTIDYCSEAMRLKPNNAEALGTRAMAELCLEKYTSALDDIEQTIRLAPNSAMAFAIRGNIKQNGFNKYVEAIADYDIAIRLNSDDANSFNNRAWAKMMLGRYSDALTDCDQAIKYDSNNKEVYATKGCILVKMGNKNRLNEAIELLDKGLRLGARQGEANACKQEALNKLKE